MRTVIALTILAAPSGAAAVTPALAEEIPARTVSEQAVATRMKPTASFWRPKRPTLTRTTTEVALFEAPNT
jgi:hypothetical protein